MLMIDAGVLIGHLTALLSPLWVLYGFQPSGHQAPRQPRNLLVSPVDPRVPFVLF